MALETSSMTGESSRSEKLIGIIWGCQLNRENPSFTFDIPQEWSYEQQLALKTICLGENAKDEFNIVEIVPPKDSKDNTPVRIATLKLSVLPMTTLAGLDLTPPVTFRLKSGSGPVYLAGQHLSAGLEWNGEEEEEEEKEEEEESSASASSSQEEEEAKKSFKKGSPVKPTKRPSAKHTSAINKDKEQPVQEQPLGKRTNKGRKPAGKGELRI